MLDSFEITSSRLISLLSLNIASRKVSGHGARAGGRMQTSSLLHTVPKSACFQRNISEFSLHVPTFPCVLVLALEWP